jgi:hypothetical protein
MFYLQSWEATSVLEVSFAKEVILAILLIKIIFRKGIEMNTILPLSRRRADWPIIIFFLINLLLITYIVDLEQLVIPDASNFSYPAWPPPVMVDMVHNYGNTVDPLLIARPPWWKATIWIDVLFFGPFYVAGLYAFVKGKAWIKTPSLIYCGMMMSNVLIILMEEFQGPHATPQPVTVLLLNAPWLLMPLYIISRIGFRTHPFSAPRPVEAPVPIVSTTAVAD